VAGPCEHGNGPSGCIKGRKLLDYLSDSWLLKDSSAPWSYLDNYLVIIPELVGL